MTRTTLLIGLIVAWFACSDDETATNPTVAASSTVSTVSAGGAAGMTGSGGTIGECPAMEASCETCDSIDLVCGYGEVCCICANLQAQVLWVCADPATNDPGCPEAEPVAAQPCQDVGITCNYCDNGSPTSWSCEATGWASAEFSCF